MSVTKHEGCSDEFFMGMEAGIRKYAWWKDGFEQVGSCGTSLTTALRNLDTEYGRQCAHRRTHDMDGVPYCTRCGVSP